MTDIKWEAPEPDGRGRGAWDDTAEALRSRPGEWALVAEDVSASTAIAIKRARLAAFAPAGSFEAVSRSASNNRRARIYARYVGGESA